MIEQDIVARSDETASTSAVEKKPEQKSKGPMTTIAKSVNRATQKTSSLTDDQKRLARNAALREWRKKNKDRVKAYMADWRSRRDGKKPQEPAQATTATPTVTSTKPSSKKTRRSTSKPTKTTKKSGAKKGGRA